MTRQQHTLARLDQLHALLRAHPGLSADELAKLLPKRACGCTFRSAGTPRTDCWACKGSGMAHAGRAVAYTDLRKLQADGRANALVAPQGIAHAWFAIVTADDVVADDLDAHWDWLADQADPEPRDMVAEAVAEHTRLVAMLADRQRATATTQRELDELVVGLCEGRSFKDVAAMLGVPYQRVSQARDRLWRQAHR